MNEVSDELLKQYISVCDSAIREGKDRFPFSFMMKAALDELKKKQVALALVDDRIQSSFALSVKDDCLSGIPDPDLSETRVCRLTVSEVEKVLANPEKYIEDPTLIDWSWLQSK